MVNYLLFIAIFHVFVVILCFMQLYSIWTSIRDSSFFFLSVVSPDSVLCHSLAVSHYTPVQRQMSWSKAQEFCQKHYVDLAVLNTEEQYFTLFNATAAKKFSFWLGLRRQSISSNWRWVNGEELSYDHWYRRNYEGRCASLEAMLQTDKKLLGRYCDELHMFVCQGK